VGEVQEVTESVVAFKVKPPAGGAARRRRFSVLRAAKT
jgi:hypothetical protein